MTRYDFEGVWGLFTRKHTDMCKRTRNIETHMQQNNRAQGIIGESR
jgi:hypothetical protein